MNDPTDIVIASCVIITVTTVVKNARNKTKAGTTFEPIVFGFLLALALLAIGFVAPGFAKALAIMGLVGAFVVNGPALAATVKSIG